MVVLLWAISLLCISFLIHLVVWKIHLPQKHRATLLKIFSLVFFLWIMFVVLLVMGYLPPFFMLSIVHIIHISLFYITMSLSYIAAYVAIEADSPSGSIANCIFKAGKAGVNRDELFKLANMNKFFSSRINSLVVDEMVNIKDGKYVVALKGSIIMNIVVYYRKILGVPKELG